MDDRAAGILMVIIGVVSLAGAQVLIKARLGVHGQVPLNPDLFRYVLGLMADWRMWLGLAGLVFSALLWYAAISRIPLSLAYPLGALAYPLIFASALIVLREPFTWTGLAGNALIVAGVLLVARAA